MAEQEIDPFFTSDEFLKTLWECGNCKKKYTGQSIREHVWECPRGDTVNWHIDSEG